jgi:hypothetical protein
VIPLPRTRAELDQAAADAEAWLDSLDPETTPADDPADLRAIGQALRRAADSQTELAEAVAYARDAGRSWTLIGLVLGISKQAARERFGDTRPKRHGTTTTVIHKAPSGGWEFVVSESGRVVRSGTYPTKAAANRAARESRDSASAS